MSKFLNDLNDQEILERLEKIQEAQRNAERLTGLDEREVLPQDRTSNSVLSSPGVMPRDIKLDAKKCARCGTANAEIAKRCAACGAALNKILSER